MFESIKNRLLRKVEVGPYWDIASQSRTALTPDLNILSQKEKWLLFVYDEMKVNFSAHEHIKHGTYETPGITLQEDLVLWTKRYSRSATVTSIAVRTPKPDPKNMVFDPRCPGPCSIRGEVHLLPTETYFKLDPLMANGIYSTRERIKVQLPWRGSWTKVRGMWMQSEFPRYLDCWAYISKPEVLDDEPYGSLSVASHFKRQQRENNRRFIFNKHYYEFTRINLK